MRRYLTALAALLGSMLLYHGLVLRGIIAGQAEPLAPAAAALLLAAAVTMGLAALTLRAHAGLAAVEMALAGVVVLAIADSGHRYLLAYGAVAVVLAVFAAVAAATPSPPAPSRPRRERRAPGQHPDSPPVIATDPVPGVEPAHAREPEAAAIEPPRRDRAAAQRVLRHVATTRGRRRAARRAWRSWRAEAAPREEEPSEASEPPAVPGAVIAAAERATGRSAGHAAESRQAGL